MDKYKTTKRLVFIIFIFSFLAIGGIALAQVEQDTGIGLPNPLGYVNPQDIIGNVIKAILGLVGSLALLAFIYGGFLWVTSAGNDEKVKKGKDVIMWSAFGLAVIFASYALVNFVIGAVTGG